jgi:hypothetical protein
MSNSKEDSAEVSPDTKTQFGCSQVIIVRDQDHKKRLPAIFDNILCLTVYESKGLEFNDVIIYNFFDDSEVSSTHWKLLQDIVYETVKIPKFDDDILDFDMLDNEKFQDFQKRIKAMENEQDECDYEEKTTISLKEEGIFMKKAKTFNIYK